MASAGRQRLESRPWNITAIRSVISSELVEVLAGHQHRGAACGEVEQGLPDHGGGAGIHAPGRLADDEDRGVTKDLAPDDEFLQIAAGQACGFGIALGLAHVEGFGGAVDRRQASRPC